MVLTWASVFTMGRCWCKLYSCSDGCKSECPPPAATIFSDHPHPILHPNRPEPARCPDRLHSLILTSAGENLGTLEPTATCPSNAQAARPRRRIWPQNRPDLRPDVAANGEGALLQNLRDCSMVANNPLPSQLPEPSTGKEGKH